MSAVIPFLLLSSIHGYVLKCCSSITAFPAPPSLSPSCASTKMSRRSQRKDRLSSCTECRPSKARERHKYKTGTIGDKIARFLMQY